MSAAVSRIDSISTDSAVVGPAAVLRRAAIGAGEDEFLGSEETLAEKLGVILRPCAMPRSRRWRPISGKGDP